MKRLLFSIFCILFCDVCNSAQIVNVEYIHKLIEQEHGITVPYNNELTNPHVAANMKYLLTTIDAANSILNGEQITDYGNGEYATTMAADTDAALEMVRDHVRNYKFFATTTSDTTSFSFTISASGVFHIDWGDGTRESYRKTNTATTTYSQEYATAGEYIIKIGGYRTGGASISFTNNLNLAKIEGSLGAIFSTIKQKDGKLTQPIFRDVFRGCTNLTGPIPENLFKGVYGQPVSLMFYWTFLGCSSLTGAIPEGLFADIKGKPASNLFNGTFNGTKITSVPENLFAGIVGPPANNMFYGTFRGCKLETIPSGLFAGISGPPAAGMFGLTFFENMKLKEIPAGIFAGISGPSANEMYDRTFGWCINATGTIPENLFGDIYGTAKTQMFYHTFSNCSKLTGTSARINGKYLYEIWPDATGTQVQGMYRGATGLTDYAEIPSNWK